VTSAKRTLSAGFFAAACCVPLFAFGGAVIDFGKLIPAAIGSWKASGEDRVYDRQSLYDYMDGGAEVYLAFDFRQVWARKYGGPDDGEMSLDIYDMGSSAEAFGIFSCDRSDPPAAIGQESTFAYGLLRFHQGRFFVTVTCSDESDASGRTVLELGLAVAAVLGPPGPPPDLLTLLPAASLAADKTSYFHAPVSLGNRYFVAADNILRLDRSTDCALAEYATSSAKPAVLLLVRYPGPEAAETARSSFLAAYLPAAGPDGTARTEDKGWVSCARHDAYVAVVFNAPDPLWSRALLSAIAYPPK
jgi:hypothetical protein